MYLSQAISKLRPSSSLVQADQRAFRAYMKL